MTGAPLPVTGSVPVVRGTLLAVVVTRGTTPWLPTTLAALAAQTRAPSRVLVVDAAPRAAPAGPVLPADDPVARLARRTLADVAPLRVVAVPGARTFGDAVRLALAAPGVAALGPTDVDVAGADRPGAPGTGANPAVGGPPAGPNPAGGGRGTSTDPEAARRAAAPPAAGGRTPEAADWLWLLHDDSAPEPTALAELVRAVEHAPSVGVAGAKQRDWDDPSRLLEVGLTTSRLGRRMTGVEDGEVDQGQHDGREDVLGVGLAGALVRRDVWDELDGPDPALGPFGDGLDLSRRARLAGHRVVVVPRAVVRHAQASYAGLRDDDLRHVLTGAAAHEPAAGSTSVRREPDPRRSYAARRRAHVHARLAAVPLPLLPLQTVAFLVVAVLRSLLRVASKEGVLAAAELAAPVVAILNPGRMARSRAAARRARRLPRRSLRALQSTWRDVLHEERDRVLGRREADRAVRAPSELELAELAALARGRRLGLAVLGVALVGLTGAVLGRLVVRALRGDALVGGGLLPAGADVGALWRGLTLGWVPAGLGVAAPGDPLLAVLLPVAALTGGSGQVAVAVLVLGAPVLAGLGAWYAAGAATRSVAVRLWAAAVWVLVPAFAVALDGGRLGAVVAHAALPWVALGVARAVGVQRLDTVAPAHADAGSTHPSAAPVPDADAPTDAPTDAPRDADAPAHADAHPDADAHGSTQADAQADADAVRAQADAVRAQADAVRAQADAEPAHAGAGTQAAAGSVTEAAGGSVTAPVAGSVTAAAAGGLALAVAVAGAPLLLPAALLGLALVALAVPRGRRARLVVVPLPALALAGPLLADALVRAGEGGWRALLAEPGLGVDAVAAPAWQALLGWPTRPAALWPDAVGPQAAAVLPFALGGTVVLLAALALLRGPAVARGVRAGWAVAGCGLTAAVVAGRVETAVVDGAAVRGWTGAGVSLALLGLLAAATLGADGTRRRTARRPVRARHAIAGALTVLAVLAPLVPLTDWVLRARTGAEGAAGAPVVRAVDGPVVPAVGQQAQTSAARSRVLALGVHDTGEVRYALLRGDGPQLTERSAAAAVRGLRGGPGDPVVAPDDAATAEAEGLVARLATGAAGDVSADLGALAVGAVLVPPAAASADEPVRAELVGRLDATAGLERITEGETGVIWRVVAPAPAGAGEADDDAGDAGAAPVRAEPVTAWARVVTPAGANGPATAAPLDAGSLSVRTTVPAGDAGRTVVLAERAHPGWRAWLDGRPLRAVEADWRQAFALGEGDGRLTVAYAPAGRDVAFAVQAVVLGLTVLLALPVRRRRRGIR